MSEVRLEPAGADGIATLVLDNPGKLNAIDIGMWRALRDHARALQALPEDAAPRAVVVRGAGGEFAAGGDIAEFLDFRFDEARLRDFHEGIVGPALEALQALPQPVYAQIDGACIGGGLEIAACCDLRVCAASSRFGAPIARLGFPMAPGELQLVARIAPDAVLREMLLEARLLGADDALRHGLVHAVVPDGQVAAAVRERIARLDGLSPQALRLNKRTLAQIARGGPTPAERHAHYAYADSPEHREGIAAFVAKRRPVFRPG
ncbi:enoyl-CoA hydratase/isomerase family protein [Piscinibacter sakaiensis]|uniref:Enoyl-CoA hydratase n=1 Tax=Piscinibacter sakaiensis TaxID=1547922 RepID=A0A0K8P010_PISS1|nr:enoyl-CoA hydratase-related protein [Piscinibacter sakaiensis]GAP35874.1 enoyl-CoA hydratase [Piscinibacter sakaiensis]